MKKCSGNSCMLRIAKLFFLIVFCVSAACILVELYGSISNYRETKQTISKYLNVSDSTYTINDQTEEQEQGPEQQLARVDFDGLRKESDDVIGWIHVDGIGCEYPLVWKDNSYYTNHTWNGGKSSHGAVFLEELNSPELSDYHSIIYGHNMKDGSMFGKLTKYAKKSFFDENGGKIILYTPNSTLVYQIFSVEYANSSDSDVYSIGFSPSSEYEKFLENMKRRSRYDTGISVTGSDHVLTLSTCAYKEKDRFVVHAKLIESYPLAP